MRLKPVDGETLIGTRWRTNDSGTVFDIVRADGPHVWVRNISPPHRERRILAAAIRISNSKTGSTAVA